MKWKTLQHNGILFPPPFESKGITVKIKGEKVSLNLLQEEMIYQWAKKKDTPYVQDKVFQKNFVSDFAATLAPKFKNISYSDIDFTVAYKIVDKEKDSRELMTKEEKKALAVQRKKIRDEMKEKYGKAILDGKEVEVANYMAEPPGIFIGRGDHPLRGRWKHRITPEDVTLNLGKEASIPKGTWEKIIHDKDSMWLASWMDDLTQKRKYVWLSDTAGLKQERDKAKYDKALTLASQIAKIKENMIKDMKSKDPKIRKIATACYLIYRTSMRVGDEKDADEADTVGATTLRKEHVKLAANSIEFDFLGKDSVRWKETIQVEGDDKQFYENLKELVANKKSHEEIFDGITSRHVNAYFSGIVKGLTAKVFRTYLATNEVKDYLKKHTSIKSESPNVKLYHAKMANLQAAIMCNHKRTIPKTFENALQKKREMLKNIQETKPKTEKQKEKLEERKEKIKLAIDLAEKTRDYNLGTSLRNYIDPRVFKAWTDEIKADWEKLYTAALQKKFLWVKNENIKWKDIVTQ
ncbi:MAG: DNA topoisomerase I [Nitrosopumilaceae archaeon]|nr:DNA topoisomerase I [Nitrosopumilaceae archaeon]